VKRGILSKEAWRDNTKARQTADKREEQKRTKKFQDNDSSTILGRKLANHQTGCNKQVRPNVSQAGMQQSIKITFIVNENYSKIVRKLFIETL
jgi:hypothetical protein